MFHAILITGSDQSLAFKLAQEISQDQLIPAPDTLIVDSETSIGIEIIREISRFLTRKAMIKDKKIIFLPHGEKLTLPAQNAFLKTLEEPPAHSQIIIITPQSEVLIPTIVSRCQIYNLTDSAIISSDFIREQTAIFSQISQGSIGQQINLAGQYTATKNQTIEFCHSQLLFLRQQMLNQKSYQLSPVMRLIIQTIVYLKQNVNPKFCLENLFFSYPLRGPTSQAIVES